MTAISYFQRYSQRENHITNNTLLMMRHLYEASPAKLATVLNELLGDDNSVAVGPAFAQQKREGQRVPDAVISQEPIRLYFETKRGEALDQNQLRGHCEGIAQSLNGQGKAVLIGLTTRPMQAHEADTIASYAKEKRVIFKSVTFAQIVEAVSGACEDYEAALRAIVADFEDFLRTQNLLDDPDSRMLVAPCGVSREENERYGIYYDGAWRPARAPCRFFGAYWDKAIRLVGEVKAVLICRYEDGRVSVEAEERGKADAEMIERIRQIIEVTPYYPELKTTDHRYFVMEGGFARTSLVKDSKGPIRGAQYLALDKIVGTADFGAMSATNLALVLEGRSFGDKPAG